MKKKYFVVNSDFNKAHHAELIGKYLEKAPSYVEIREVDCIETVADLKRTLKVGMKLASTYHLDFTGTHDAKGHAISIYQDKYLGIREVSIVQTTQFALKTLQPSTGKYKDSWMNYPSAKQISFNEDGSFTIYEEDSRQEEPTMIPVITYTIMPDTASQVEFTPGTPNKAEHV